MDITVHNYALIFSTRFLFLIVEHIGKYTLLLIFIPVEHSINRHSNEQLPLPGVISFLYVI